MAGMTDATPSTPAAPALGEQLDALMTLLAVARLGRYSAAAEALGVNHSTVSRRLAGLEKAVRGRVLARTPDGWETTALGDRLVSVAEEIESALTGLGEESGGDLRGMLRLAAPDGFTTSFAAPAAAALQSAHPHVDVELISATQRVRQVRSGVDIEVVVGRPSVHKAVARHLLDYSLGLYAAPAWLERHGVPRRIEDLQGAPLVYYIESMLRVDALDMAVEALPLTRSGVRSTSVFAQISATAASAGVGVLPLFLAEERAARGELTRLLPGEFEHSLSYWAVVRREALRSPLVAAGLEALEAQCRG